MLIWENKQKLVSSQASIKYKDGNLMINDEPYENKVQPPSVRRILTITGAERDILNGMKWASSEVFEEKGSSFTGYALDVSSLKEITVAYTYLKKKYADR